MQIKWLSSSKTFRRIAISNTMYYYICNTRSYDIIALLWMISRDASEAPIQGNALKGHQASALALFVMVRMFPSHTSLLSHVIPRMSTCLRSTS